MSPTRISPNAAWKVTLSMAVICFLTYATIYGFRKPFTVGIYADKPTLLGIDYKSLLVVSQVIGYLCSKIYGIRFIAQMEKKGRGKLILGLVGFSWLAMLGFAMAPPETGPLWLFLNGFPHGLLWGVIFSYVEGRKSTDLIGASLSVSFIFASGFVKTITELVRIQFAVSESWLPFLTGIIFVLPLLVFIFLLEKLPPPSAADIELRGERLPMNKQQRKQLVRSFLPGLIALIVVYSCLTIFRELRDNFNADMWRELGFAGMPEKFVQTEIPITLFLLLVVGAMVLIRKNIRALLAAHAFIAAGFLLAGISSYLFITGSLDPFNWMMLVGLGLYAGYIPFNCMLFERLIASFKYAGNVGFLIYLADAFGYTGSVAVTLSKSLFSFSLKWSSFYAHGVIGLSIFGLIITLFSVLYFRRKYLLLNN